MEDVWKPGYAQSTYEEFSYSESLSQTFRETPYKIQRTREFPPRRIKSLLESNSLKSKLLIGGLGVLCCKAARRRKVCAHRARFALNSRVCLTSYGQFSKFHVCFCGLDSGNLKFETVRTNKQHICF